MNLIKPRILPDGGTVEFIAPAGQVEYDEILKAKNFFTQKGYKVKFGEHLFDDYRYMAGKDEDRISDLHKAFLDEEVDAIICARGGYGAIRLIKYIDFDIIRRHPKIFCGYSDITALSAMFLKYADLITFSGPMAQSDFNTTEPDHLIEQSFFNVLKGVTEEYCSTETYLYGTSEGITWGGNLSTLVSLCGIDFIPDEKFIFFTEDINEPLYKIDKMLNQLFNIKKFRENIAGIAFGEFIGTEDNDWRKELFKEFADSLNVPAYGGFKFTHGTSKQTIPYGAKAILDGNLITQ